MIYLDYAATTPIDESVATTYQQAQATFFANPDSLHPAGKKAMQLILDAKAQMASYLNIVPEELYITGSATEANNIALFGIARANRERGNHIITTTIEHASVSGPLRQLENEGYEVTYIAVNSEGIVSTADVLAAVRADTICLSVMHVNNELGTIQPIEELAQAVKKQNNRVIIHTDMAQSFGKLPINLDNIDCATFSGHKFFAPKGIGLLVKKKNIKMMPLLFGGQHQQGLRPGTMNAPLIAATAKAMRLAVERLETGATKQIELLNQELRRYFAQRPDIILLEKTETVVPHILHVRINDTRAEIETYINALGADDICISTRSTCHSKSLNKANPILEAIGCSKEESRRSLRISLSHRTTAQEIQKFITSFDAIEKILKKNL